MLCEQKEKLKSSVFENFTVMVIEARYMNTSRDHFLLGKYRHWACNISKNLRIVFTDTIKSLKMLQPSEYKTMLPFEPTT